MERETWLDRVEYPFAPHYLQLSMGRMHYVDEGAGQPVVMVHGTPEWSFGYRHLIKGLSPRCRCIAPDHIGFGLSDKPAGWSYLPEAHAQNLKTLIEHLNLEPFTLVVHDYGGPIGLAYAVEHPEKVRRLVLMNTWMWSLRGDRHFDATRLFAGRVGRFLYERLNFSPRVLMKQAMGDKSKLPPHIHAQYLRALPDPRARHGTWVFARELLGSSAWYASLWQRRDRMKDIPALLVWGMKDFAFRPQELARWQALFPSAKVVTLAEVGHFVTEEVGPGLSPTIAEFIESWDP